MKGVIAAVDDLQDLSFSIDDSIFTAYECIAENIEEILATRA